MLELLTRHIGLKLVSLGLAVLLWSAFVGEPEMATSITASVQFRNPPPDLELSIDSADYVQLEVRGPSTKLTHASLASTSVIFDLAMAGGRPGERTFSIARENATLPAGVTLARAVPSQVRVRLERRIARDVPVSVRFTGAPPEGWHIVRQEVTPAVLRVVGPESRIGLVRQVETDAIDLSGAAGQATFEVNSFVPDPHVRFDRSSRVTVKLALEKDR